MVNIKYLFDNIEKIKYIIIKVKKLWLFLDFDGTLSPIVSNPDDAYIDHEIKDILEKLKENPKISVGIISGRALDDLEKRINLNNIIYAGNHGMEIKKGDRVFINEKAYNMREEIRHISEEVERRLNRVKGIIIENKGLTVSFHYRMADPETLERLKNIINILINGNNSLKIRKGKKVIEIIPNINWNKGKAIRYILSGNYVDNILILYIGDDKTDEDAFKEVSDKKGISIFVGDPPQNDTYANYYLKNLSDVKKFLRIINESIYIL
jgi:trehalose 6-phosphate phosphatase